MNLIDGIVKLVAVLAVCGSALTAFRWWLASQAKAPTDVVDRLKALEDWKTQQELAKLRR